MKKFLFLAILPLAAICAIGAGVGVAGKPLAVRADWETVSVVHGVGSVKAEPDVAYVTFNVETKNENLDAARTENADSTASFLAALAAQGTAEEDMKTVGFYIYPEYNFNEAMALTGYRVTNSVRVKLTDLESIGAVIDTATANGANAVPVIEFCITNREQIYNDALSSAAKAAKEKAAALCTAAGATDINILSLKEAPNNYFAQEHFGFSKAMPFDTAGAGTAIMHDTMEVSATVNLAFELVW